MVEETATTSGEYSQSTTGSTPRELRVAVAQAWAEMDVPQSTFAQYLQQEAKVAGAYHDPAAYAPSDELRQRVKGAYQQFNGERGTFCKSLRRLAEVYEEAPEMEVVAVQEKEGI